MGGSKPFSVWVAVTSLVSSTRFIDLTAFAWTNNTVRVMPLRISGATFDLAATTLSVQVGRDTWRLHSTPYTVDVAAGSFQVDNAWNLLKPETTAVRIKKIPIRCWPLFSSLKARLELIEQRASRGWSPSVEWFADE